MQDWEARASAECNAVEVSEVPQPPSRPPLLPFPSRLKEAEPVSALEEDLETTTRLETALRTEFEALLQSMKKEEGEREKQRDIWLKEEEKGIRSK